MSLILFLIKKKFLCNTVMEPPRRVVPRRRAYSRGIIQLKRLAPAITHKRASSLILVTTQWGIEAVLRNTLAFLSLQISQTVSMTRVAIAFFLCPLERQMCSHQAFTEPKASQSSKTSSGSPIHILIALQILKE